MNLESVEKHHIALKLPAMSMSWMRHSRNGLDIIVGSQEWFDEWQNLLEKAFGPPGPKIRSDGLVIPDLPVGNGRSVTFSP